MATFGLSDLQCPLLLLGAHLSCRRWNCPVTCSGPALGVGFGEERSAAAVDGGVCGTDVTDKTASKNRTLHSTQLSSQLINNDFLMLQLIEYRARQTWASIKCKGLHDTAPRRSPGNAPTPIFILQ